MPLTKPPRARRPVHLRTIALAGVALVVVALGFPRFPSAPASDAPEEATPEPRPLAATMAGAMGRPAAPIAVPVDAPRSMSVSAGKPVTPRREKGQLTESTRSRASIAPTADDARLTEDAAARVPSEPIAPAAPAPAPSAIAATAPVTITGCLEVSIGQDEYRLTDTEGIDAPKSRSWRTGFLKKRSAPIALVDVPDRQMLQAQVGRRVAATGLLTSHDLKVSALRFVGPACD